MSGQTGGTSVSRGKQKSLTALFVVISVVSLAIVMLDSLGRSLFPSAPDPALTGEEPPVPEGAFCVMTYNIAHGRGTSLHQVLVRNKTIRRNLRILAQYVKNVSPDVAGFQEVDVDCDWSGNFNHAEFLAEEAGYRHCRFGVNNVKEGGYKLNYGNSIVSKHPVVRFENYPFGDAKVGEKGFLVAEIEIEGRVITFAVAHLDYKSAANRRLQIEKMVKVLKGTEGPLVVMGDFNCELDGREDSLRLLVDELSLACRAFPEGQGATFPAKSPRSRIDFILVSDHLEILACVSPQKELTDHLPVIAVIKYSKP
jgi:endonuclease/exonuclease/phosphatase family metal-dependent hydrolase